MTTELILPKFTHELSKSVGAELERIDGLLHPSIRTVPALRQQFWAQAIVEVNGLKPNTDMGSVLVAIANVCQIGLTFGKQLGHAYLVPFKGKATLVVGYKGFLKLAYESGFLDHITTELALKGEECKAWVDENGRHIHHVIPIDRAEPTPDNTLAAYTVFRTKSGHTDAVIAPGWDIRKINDDAVEKAAKWGGRSVWQDNFGAMAMKCPIRRAAKLWDQTPELALAVHLDEQADRDEQQTNDAIEPPRLTEADGLRATLMATLRDKVGCKDVDERGQVIHAAGLRGCRDVQNLDTQQCLAVMDWLNDVSESVGGWGGVLGYASSI
jgi:phage RecT family recombinase